MGAGSALRVVTFYPPTRDLVMWADKNRTDQAPGTWPYGLHQLRNHYPSVVASTFPPDTRMRAATRRMARSLPVRRGGTEHPIGITWDENSAGRLAATCGLRARLCGVVWATDLLHRKSEADLRNLRRDLRRMDGLWVLSEAQVDPLQRWLGPASPPVHQVTFGVDTRFFRAAPYPEEPLVVSVGGDRDRDPQTLFRAMGQVRAARPDVQVIVQSKTTLAAPAGVTVVPHFDHAQLRDLYARASVVVIATSPNLHVSGMTVGLEAMATGRPLVITRTPGMEDYFPEDNPGCFLTDLGDADQLAHHALALLDCPSAAATAGRHARAMVESSHSDAHLADRLAELIRLSV